MFIFVTVAGLFILPFFVLFLSFLKCRTFDHSLRWAITFYGWFLVRAVPFFAPVKVEYRSGKLPLPCILAANHSSALDPYLFGILFINATFITSWPFKIPVYGPLMRLAGYISAGEGWDSISRRGSQLLNSGVSLIMWPEGHRSRNGRLGPFKKGAFALSALTGYPVVPVCIKGAGRLMAPGKHMLTPCRIKMVMLDPIYPDSRKDSRQEITEMRDKAFNLIREELLE